MNTKKSLSGYSLSQTLHLPDTPVVIAKSFSFVLVFMGSHSKALNWESELFTPKCSHTAAEALPEVTHLWKNMRKHLLCYVYSAFQTYITNIQNRIHSNHFLNSIYIYMRYNLILEGILLVLNGFFIFGRENANFVNF